MLATASVEGGVWRLIAQNGPLAVRVRGRVHSSSDLALLELACLGHGIIYIPWFAVRDEVLGGRLQLLLEPYCRLERGVYVIYPQRRNMPAKVSAFADFLAAHVDWSGTVPAQVST